MNFSTSQNGDIVEATVSLECLRRGWEVLFPNGNRLPYDFVLDIKGRLLKIQVKRAWFDQKNGLFKVKKVRTLANRKEIKIQKYNLTDFDFAICCIFDLNEYYIIPSKEFIKGTSGKEICLRNNATSQRDCFGEKFLNRWDYLETI